MKTKIRVLLAEDHETVREGLRLVLESQPDIEVVAEAANGRAALARAGALQPEVAVVDIAMPGLNGLAAARAMRLAAPATAIVALTRYGDDAYVEEMLAAGALGYVLKQSPSTELVNAIRSVAEGRPYLDSRLPRPWPRRGTRRERPQPAVSVRERAVLRLTALGYSNKEIAARLDISVKTVEVHKANAMRKLGLHGRVDVVRYASLQGWLHEP